MKIHMEIDLTPEELKALLGWPEISLMQRWFNEQPSVNDSSVDQEKAKAAGNTQKQRNKNADAPLEESLDSALKDNIKQSMSSMSQIQGLFVEAFSEAIKDMRRNPGKDD